jgi:hypothetical protein
MSGKSSSLVMRFIQKIVEIINYRPSPYIVAIILAAITIFLLGGGIYDVTLKPRSVIPYSSGFIFLYPSLHEQILNESIAIMIVYALGAAGLILIYRSTRYMRNPEQASLLIKIGAALLILTFIVVEAALYLWKLGLAF